WGAESGSPTLPAGRTTSERLQELHEVRLLPRVESEREVTVVVVDDVLQGGEATVVVEASLLADEEPLEGVGAVARVGRADRLDVGERDLVGRVHVAARVGVERRYVATGALRSAREELAPALGRLGVEAPLGRAESAWRRSRRPDGSPCRR